MNSFGGATSHYRPRLLIGVLTPEPLTTQKGNAAGEPWGKT